MTNQITDPKDAWKALAEGKEVFNALKDRHKLDGECLVYLSSTSGWTVTSSIGPGPWAIVESEPKKLTFTEALQLLLKNKPIKVEAPKPVVFTDAYGSAVMMLDLAERRGWPLLNIIIWLILVLCFDVYEKGKRT